LGKCEKCNNEITEGYKKVTLEKYVTTISDRTYCIKCIMKERIREMLKVVKNMSEFERQIYGEIKLFIEEVLKEG